MSTLIGGVQYELPCSIIDRKNFGESIDLRGGACLRDPSITELVNCRISFPHFLLDKRHNITVYNQNYGYKKPVNFTAAKDDYIIIEVNNRQYNSAGIPSVYEIGVYPINEE